MFSRRALLLYPLFFFLTAVLCGCSDSYAGRMAVSGKVVLDGRSSEWRVDRVFCRWMDRTLAAEVRS